MPQKRDPELTPEQLEKKFRSQLAKLKVHLVRGCLPTSYAEPVEKAYATQTKHQWGDGPDDWTWWYANHPAVTDDLRKVTCGYCKTKLINELWFKDWSELTEQEFVLLAVLRERRDIRKSDLS